MKIRRLSPELLDTLSPDNPAARASRRDLQRLHPILGQVGLWTRWFQEYYPARPPSSLADLGAGDGSLLGTVLLRAYPKGGHGARIFFVDRQPVVPEATLIHLRRRNWLPTVIAAEALDWIEDGPPVDTVIANLFLHHLDESALRRLFSGLAGKTNAVAAAEPRRGFFARWGAEALFFLGCHSVTRHDARVSVEAGFTGREISNLWPSPRSWHLQEKPVGPFTHFFFAAKTG